MKAREVSTTLAFTLLLIASPVYAETTLQDTAKRCAKAMLVPSSEAVACMHPHLVSALGGPNAAKSMLQKQADSMARDGASIERVSIGAPHKPIEINGRIFALVPQDLRIRVPQGALRQSAFLLAIRESSSSGWTFIDSAAATPEALALLFPDTDASAFKARLKIPPRASPVLER